MKKHPFIFRIPYLIAFIFLAFPLLVNSQTKKYSCVTPSEISYSKINKKISKGMEASKLRASNHCQGGIFDLTFSSGFSEEEEVSICGAFVYLSSVIDLGSNVGSPKIYIGKENITVEGALAKAYPNYIQDGCNKAQSSVLLALTTNELDNSTVGSIFFNSNVDFWHTTNNDPFEPMEGEIDLYSVALHEALHLLGFSSRITADGNPPINSTTQIGGYSPWDKFLFSTNINSHIVVEDLNDLACCEPLTFNNLISFPDDINGGDNCTNNIFFNINGNNIAGVNAKGYSGTLGDEEVQNILSHLDCDAGAEYVMESIFNPNLPERRILTADEISILGALGYINNNSCQILARTDGEHDLTVSNSILISSLLDNDILPNNFEFEINPICGNVIPTGATVDVTGNNVVINNLPSGTFRLCYTVKGCDGECSDGQIKILNYPILSDCDNCQGEELFCHGSFDDFTPGYANGIALELGLPTCFPSSGQNSPDIFAQPNDNIVVHLIGPSVPSAENIYIPLSPPLQPGCNVTVNFDAVRNCGASASLQVLGSTAGPCPFQATTNCDNFPCIGNAEIENCSEFMLPPTNLPLVISDPLEFKNYTLESTNSTSEPWNYIIISHTGIGSMNADREVLIDNVSITSDCCNIPPPPPCLVYEFNPSEPEDEDDEYNDVSQRNCEGVIITYCADGSMIFEVLSENIEYIKLFIDSYSNTEYVCAEPLYNQLNPPADCFDDGPIHTYQLDPGSQVLLIEVAYADDLEGNGEECYIIPPSEYNSGLQLTESSDTGLKKDNELEKENSFEIKTNTNSSLKNTVSIFPNPAKESVNLRNPNTETYQLEIFNSNGIQVLATQLNPESMEEISLDKFNTGIYFVKFTNLTSNEVKAEKLVIIK